MLLSVPDFASAPRDTMTDDQIDRMAEALAAHDPRGTRGPSVAQRLAARVIALRAEVERRRAEHDCYAAAADTLRAMAEDEKKRNEGGDS